MNESKDEKHDAGSGMADKLRPNAVIIIAAATLIAALTFVLIWVAVAFLSSIEDLGLLEKIVVAAFALLGQILTLYAVAMGKLLDKVSPPKVSKPPVVNVYLDGSKLPMEAAK